MKCACTQQALYQALTTVGKAVASRSTLPILTNVLLTAKEGRMTLLGNNLALGIQVHIDATVWEEGIVAIPAKIFSELVASLSESEIVLELAAESKMMGVTSPRSRATLRVNDPTEFPPFPLASDDPPVPLDVTLLKEMIRQTAFAAAKDDSSPIFTALQLEVAARSLTITAIDNFRVARRQTPLALADQEPMTLLVPAQALEELVRILPREGIVTLSVTDTRNQVLFQTERIALAARVIEGTFPNVGAAIPSTHKSRVVANTAEFVAALRTVMPFARDHSNITCLTFSAETGAAIEATAEDVGSNTSTLDASVEGSDLSIIFNGKWLLEVLGVIDSEQVALELNSPYSPGLIKPVGPTGFLSVLMPMSSNT